MKTDEIPAHVRFEFAKLELPELLRKPPSVLLGVSARAEAALQSIGLHTVFDLGSSWLFANARAASNAGTARTASGRFGIAPSDWLNPDASWSSLDQIGRLPVKHLRGLDDAQGAELELALDVHHIRDFAYWPPYLAARQLVGEVMGSTLEPEEQQAEELRPRFGEFPTERIYYTTLVMLQTLAPDDEVSALPRKSLLKSSKTGRNDSRRFDPAHETSNSRHTLTQPISLMPAVGQNSGFTTPAIGAILTLSQSWYAEGVTLGHLLHCVALAPGENTRIAVIDWSRRTRATTTEAITETESIQAATSHGRAVSEVQQGIANEFQAGGSTSYGFAASDSSASASSGGSGFAISAWWSHEGSSAEQSAQSTSLATSSSWSLGSRSVMANMVQQVNDRTEQHASSVRNRRATAVREVAQAEHEAVSTRVVANYNHMHALTVQYYEVVQVYRTVARLHRADRCLFLPFELLDFAGARGYEIVERFRGALLRGALNRRVASLLLDDTESVSITAEQSPQGYSYNEETVQTASRMVGRPILGADAYLESVETRLRPPAIHLPGDTEIVALVFDQVNVKAVQLDRVVGTSADNTFSVLEGGGLLNLPPGVRLADVDALYLAQTEAEAVGGIILHCVYRGRRFSTPRIPVVLVGTLMQKVVSLENDRENRQQELLTHLQANRAHYSVVTFRSLDSPTIALLLSQYRWNGKPLVDQVEPKVITVAGNYLLFRAPIEQNESSGVTDAGRRLSWDELLQRRGIQSGDTDERVVPIPTGGVFAEAVLGRSNSAEKLDITRFWNWQDSPIPLQAPEIAPVGTGTRGEAEDLKPGALGPPVLNIVNPTSLPDPAGLGALLQTIASGNMFRDMSGLTGTQGLVQSAMAGTLTAATDAGKIAAENLKTHAQKSIALAQVAADIVKSALKKDSGSTGGTTPGGISGAGALINHGRDMDARGVASPAPVRDTALSSNPARLRSTSPPPVAASPTDMVVMNGTSTPAVNGELGPGQWTGTYSGPQRGYSHEASFANQSAFGFSPDAVNATTAAYSDDVAAEQVVFSPEDYEAMEKYVPLWQDLLTFNPPSSIQAELESRTLRLQGYEDAIGDLNLDLYPVRIIKLPRVRGVQLDAIGLLQFIRLHLNDLVDNEVSEFLPYEPGIDDVRWRSPNPVGSVFHINVVGPDDAVVVGSLVEPTRWRFSTVTAPDDWGPTTHPVSGHREWGFREMENGELTFYTRGADRSTLAPFGLEYLTFWGAAKLWKSFQEKLAAFVNANEGSASIGDSFSQRLKWSLVSIHLNRHRATRGATTA